MELSKTEFRVMSLRDYETLRQHSLYPLEKENPSTPCYENFAYEHLGELYAGGGFALITETTAWAWVCLTDAVVPGHVRPVYQVMKEFIELWCREHGIIRLQAFVREGFERGYRLVEHLGFQPEGYLMPHFCGKDKAAQLFVRYFHET